MSSMTQISNRQTTSLKDFLAIFHLFNGVSSGVGVMIGYIMTVWHAGIEFNYVALLSAALSTLLISSGGFVINDILDVEIDRVNRPDRPIAAGKVSIPAAWAAYIATTALGIVLALSINSATGGLSVVTAAALFLYSYTLKKRFLVGHITVAALGALLFPFGGLAAGVLFPTIYSVLFTFPAFVAREVLKTVPDYEGDKANGVDNIATRYGPQTALRVAQISMGLTAVILPFVPLVWSLNAGYTLITLVVIWPLMFSTLYKATADNVTSIIRLSKLLFLLVAAALRIGSIPGI
jgi:geranylgeranylglycerol-phosphate geranylgeranyltransferase